MRRTFTAVLVLLLGLDGTAADAEDVVVPQSPDRQERMFRDAVEWNKQLFEGSFEKVGKKDARWDKPARETVAAAARCFGRAVDPSVSLEEVHALAVKATDAGCDDPLLVDLRARTDPPTADKAAIGRRAVSAAEAMAKSAYPPVLQARSLCRAGVLLAEKPNLKADERTEATRLLQSALALVPKTVTNEAPSPGDLREVVDAERYALIMEILVGLRVATGDYAVAYGKVDAVLDEAPALSVLRLQVNGGYLIKYAWEARGIGPGATVDPDGGQKFAERLDEAYKVLTKAWLLEPTPKGTRTPGLMLVVARGLGMDRDEMELWFKRAMEADPNSAYACEMKMDYVDPKWHGSVEELMAFSAACRATKNWRAGITLVAVQAHQRVSYALPEEKQEGYLRSKEVWDDVRSAYEEYLEHFPGDHAARSMYAAYACLCDRIDESDQQFKLLGANLVANRFVHLDRMEDMKKYVDSAVKTKKRAQAR